jgi:Protein of unknown function (DUF1566)
MMLRTLPAVTAGLSLLCNVAAPPSVDLETCTNAVRFTLNDGEALDRATGLTWKRCSEGLTWEKGTCVGEPHFFSLDQARKLAAEGWRIPDIDELSGLLDQSCGKPAIDTKAFPDISATEEGDSTYWSLSGMGMLNLVYTVDFMNGIVDGHSPGISYAVRLVRDGKR